MANCLVPKKIQESINCFTRHSFDYCKSKITGCIFCLDNKPIISGVSLNRQHDSHHKRLAVDLLSSLQKELTFMQLQRVLDSICLITSNQLMYKLPDGYMIVSNHCRVIKVISYFSQSNWQITVLSI